jgi:predicted alpha-1,6-mannanase (GH76 family)
VTPTTDSGTASLDGASHDGTAADGGGPDANLEAAPYLAFDAGPLPTVIEAGPGDDWQACDNAALLAFANMYSTQLGVWNNGPRWSFANDVEAVESSFLRSGGQNFADLMVATYDLNAAGKFLNDLGYDDEAWWAHAWIRAFDLTGNGQYLASAKYIFADMTTAWETATCGGGIWWNRNRNYKNAVTNELFLLIAASLHNRTAGDSGPGSYIDWAEKEWGWFEASGMINSSHLVNDGLAPTANPAVCNNNGQTTWTYNQGVVLGGLAEMFEATGDPIWVSRAESIADAAITKLSDATGVMQEPCGVGGCNTDQISFKGIFVRHLRRLYDQDRKPAYFDFIVVNARSAWANDRDANNEFDGNWSGPFATTLAPSQDSAMFALSALADPVSQASVFLRPAANPSFNHPLGARAATLGWACDTTVCPAAGLMQSGPYVWYLTPGAHTAHLRVSVDSTSPRSDTLATFDVYDQASGATLASKPIAWSDFAEANVSREVTAAYTQPPSNEPVEYRVNWAAATGAPRLVVTDVSLDGEQSFSGANLFHECGRLDGTWHWSADRFADAKPCLATNGPGFTLPAGDYVATFELRVQQAAADGSRIATLAVVDHDLGAVAGTFALNGSQFTTTMFRTFAIPFHAVAGHHWDLRTEWAASATAPRLSVRGVYVRHAVTQTEVSLPFDQRGLSAVPGDGSIDGSGSAIDLALLGPTLATGDVTFMVGQAGNNVLQGGGANVPVTVGKYGSLELLGLATNGPQIGQGFKLTYADATTQVVTRSVSDWVDAVPQADERVGLALPYRWSTTRKEYGNFHLFRYSLPVDPSRMLSGFTLPANANVKILGATLLSP